MTSINHLIRFPSSFRSRLFLIFTFFTSIIAISFILLVINSEMRNFRERSADKARLLASQLAVAIRLPLYAENIADLTRHAEEILATPQVVRVIVTGSNKKTVVDVFSPIAHGDLPLASATVIVSSTPDSPSAETALSGVKSAGKSSLGEVTVFIDTTDLKASINSAIIGSATLAVIFWLAVLLACYPVLKRVTCSFDALTSGLDRMMDGDFNTKIVVEGDNEAGRAAQAVNRLALALEEREAENRLLQEELLNSMRLEVQEEKRLIMAKLIQTNRMTSLGLLISSMAHNINTPNGAIKLAAQHLASSWKDALPILEQVTREEGEFTLGGLPFGVAKTEIKGANESILNNADRVGRVIQDLRAYNLGEKSEFSPGVSLNHVVGEAMTIIRAHGSQGGVSINPILASSLPKITGNQYQLEQVVVNLLLNAMQSMSNGTGVVTIATEYSVAAAEVRLTITDQGGGIPPEVQKHLFEAFFSTRLDKGGSGLGLYISKFIVAEHKGRLTIKSDNILGTVATVHLPVACSA